MFTRRHAHAVSLAIVVLLVAGACGPKSRNVAGQGEAKPEAPIPRPAIETQQPLLRWIPKDAELVLMARSLDDLEALGRSIAPLTDVAGFSQSEFFASSWLREGIDASRPMALFTRGRTATVLAPPSGTGPLNPAWTVVEAGGPAAARWGETSREDWVEVLREASRGVSYSSHPSASWSLTPEPADRVQGYLPVAQVLATAVGGEQYLSCLALLKAAGGFRLAARTLETGGLEATAQLQLSPAAVQVLGGVLGPGPTSGIVELRTTEAAHVSFALELPKAALALREHGCPEAAETLETSIQNMPWSPPPKALHAVGTRFDPGTLGGTVALRVDQHNRRFIAKQLDQIPGRSFFESKTTVGGQSVTKLSIPTMSALYYQNTDSSVLFATKKSLMASLLGEPGPVGAAGQEILALGLWPARLRQLRELLLQVLPGREEADRWTDLLQRFEYAGLRLELGDRQLQLKMSIVPAP